MCFFAIFISLLLNRFDTFYEIKQVKVFFIFYFISVSLFQVTKCLFMVLILVNYNNHVLPPLIYAHSNNNNNNNIYIYIYIYIYYYDKSSHK